MIRTQIQLTEQQANALKELAHRENASIAELIRRALDGWLETATSMPPEERQRRAIAAAKGFETGIDDLARNHDKYFADTIEHGKQEYRQRVVA